MHTQKPYHHLHIVVLFISLVLQNCGQPNQEFGTMEASSANERLANTIDQRLSPPYGSFAASSGALVTFQQKQEEVSWTARVEETGTPAREQHLGVGCAGDITKTLSQLQHQYADYVNSRIHVLSPAQSPTDEDAFYLGQLGLSGGMKQGGEENDTSTLPSLHQAAQKGYLAVIKYLVEEKEADANARDDFGSTALHWAACGGHLAVIKYLVEEKNTDVNARDSQRRTALHWAAIEGHLAVVKYLTEKGEADVSVRDNHGMTGLHDAAQKGHLAIIEYLVEKGKADVNARDNRGMTGLHDAAQKGHLAVIKYLVEKGEADVSARDNDERTALHLAACRGHLAVIKYLIEEKKADLNTQDSKGATTLHYAALKGDLPVLNYLVEAKNANVNVRDNQGMTALHWAVLKEDLAVIKYLVNAKNADVNVRDSQGMIALHWAVLKEDLAVIKYLVEEGEADVNVRDNRGRTGLHWAAQEGHLEIILYLMEEVKGGNNSQITEDLEHLCFEQWENIGPYVWLITLADRLYSKESPQTLRPGKISAITDATLKLKLIYRGQGSKPSKECPHDLVTAFSNRFKNRIRKEGVPEAMLLDPEGYFKSILLPDSLRTELQTFVELINAGKELYSLHASSLVALLEANEDISSTPLSFILCPPGNFRPYNPEDLVQRSTVEFYTQRSAKLARLAENAEDVDRELSSEEIQRALCKYLLTYLSQLEPHAEIIKAVVEDGARKDLVVNQIQSMLVEDDVLLSTGLKAKLALLLKELLTPSVP